MITWPSHLLCLFPLWSCCIWFQFLCLFSDAFGTYSIFQDVVFLRKLKQKNHFKQLLISQGFLSTWLWLSCEPIQAFDTGSNQDRFRTNSLFGLAPENSFHNASHYSSLLTKKVRYKYILLDIAQIIFYKLLLFEVHALNIVFGIGG